MKKTADSIRLASSAAATGSSVGSGYADGFGAPPIDGGEEGKGEAADEAFSSGDSGGPGGEEVLGSADDDGEGVGWELVEPPGGTAGDGRSGAASPELVDLRPPAGRGGPAGGVGDGGTGEAFAGEAAAEAGGEGTGGGGADGALLLTDFIGLSGVQTFPCLDSASALILRPQLGHSSIASGSSPSGGCSEGPAGMEDSALEPCPVSREAAVPAPGGAPAPPEATPAAAALPTGPPFIGF